MHGGCGDGATGGGGPGARVEQENDEARMERGRAALVARSRLAVVPRAWLGLGLGLGLGLRLGLAVALARVRIRVRVVRVRVRIRVVATRVVGAEDVGESEQVVDERLVAGGGRRLAQGGVPRGHVQVQHHLVWLGSGFGLGLDNPKHYLVAMSTCSSTVHS